MFEILGPPLPAVPLRLLAGALLPGFPPAAPLPKSGSVRGSAVPAGRPQQWQRPSPLPTQWMEGGSSRTDLHSNAAATRKPAAVAGVAEECGKRGRGNLIGTRI